MRNKVIEVDCRICRNLGDDECLKYGKDCDTAVERCSADGFRNYRKISILKGKEDHGKTNNFTGTKDMG